MYISKPIRAQTTQGSLRRLVVSAPKQSPTLTPDPGRELLRSFRPKSSLKRFTKAWVWREEEETFPPFQTLTI